MASAEMSISSSDVDQLETEIRIACMPCHVVAPSQHVPSSCTLRMTSAVDASESANRSTLIENYVIQYSHSLPLRETVRHPARQRTAPVDHIRNPLTPQTAKSRIHRKTAGSPRSLRNPVVVIARMVGERGIVSRAQTHGRVVRRRIAHKYNAGIVRHIQPFVAIDGERIGNLNPPHEFSVSRRSGGPQTESAIHVQPPRCS